MLQFPDLNSASVAATAGSEFDCSADAIRVDEPAFQLFRSSGLAQLAPAEGHPLASTAHDVTAALAELGSFTSATNVWEIDE